MAEDFDTSRASRDHRKLLGEIQSIRDELTNEVINYNWNRVPTSEDEVKSSRADIRRYLERAQSQLESVLRGLR